MIEWTKSNEIKWKSQTQCRQALNPRGWVNLILPCWSGAPVRKQGDSILLSTVSRQVALTTVQGNFGWKLKVWTFPWWVSLQRFHQPVQSVINVCFARICSHLMPVGCINSTRCQWRSSLFWVSQLVWEVWRYKMHSQCTVKSQYLFFLLFTTAPTSCVTTLCDQPSTLAIIVILLFIKSGVISS